jgi:hypothetical protein
MITDSKDPKIIGNMPRFYNKTQQAVDLIVKHGVDEKTALVLSGCKTQMSNGNLSRFREKVRKYALTAPAMVKMAHNAVKDTLAMKPITYEASKPVAGIGIVDYTETIMPSITNRLAAAAMVLDRDQPIVRMNVNANLNSDMDPIDLAAFMSGGK